MMVLDQDLPSALRLAMARAFAGTTVHDLRPCFPPTVDVGTGIDRIGEHRVKRCVSWQFPNHLALDRVMRK